MGGTARGTRLHTTRLDASAPAHQGHELRAFGLLAIQFRAGSLPGLYRPTVELIGGDSFRFTIEATKP